MNLNLHYKYGGNRHALHKFLLVMKLIVILITTAILQVSASTYAQKITLNKTNMPLEKVMKEIRLQTGYDFFYDLKLIKNANPVSINVKNASLEEVLDKCFANQPLTYKIGDKVVMIKEKERGFFENIVNRFQTIDVSGRITDESGQPIAGATIKVKGTSVAATSNSEGVFTMKNVNDGAVLEISYIGFQAKEVKASENLGNIRMEMAVGKLDEVTINAGYYTVTEKERTGSISRITAKDIEKQPVNNVLQAMQANLPGISITQNSGVPGGGFNVQIRGRNSIGLANEPFYVIDGVPFTFRTLAGSRALNMTPNASPLASINPADIESIEVLKDADATAIYGSRGANGVVLITTKKGKPGKAITSVSISQGVSRVGHKVELMDTQEYLTMRKEAFANDNRAVSTTDYDVNGVWDSSKYTDWQKELIGGIAPSTNISATLSGGSSNLTYLIGATHYSEGTVFPGENTYCRNSGNFSLQFISDNKKLKTSFDANYSQVNSDLFLVDLTRYITLAPNYPNLLGDNGSLNWGNNTMIQNPIADTRQPYNSKTSNLLANGTISYEILKSLTLKGTMGYTIMERKEVSNYPLTTFSPMLNPGADRRQAFFANNSVNTWISEAQVDYRKKIGIGSLSMLLGTTFQQDVSDRQEVSGAGYSSDILLGSLAAASTLSIPEVNYFKYRYTAVFGRINYNFNDKYILNLTARRDGSSRFGVEKRFANFGAVGAAWVISNEKFFSKVNSVISFAKIRGSFGVTGNDRIRDYGYLELWRTSSGSTSTYQGTAVLVPSQLENPMLAWEVNKKFEGALEIGLFKDKVFLSAGYYSNKSSNQLLSKQLTPSTGFVSISDNLPAKVSNTGLEFLATSKNINGKLFTWSTSVNLTIPRNKLLEYPGLATSGDATLYAIGSPLSIKKVYNTNVDPQTGLYTIQDLDKNGVLDTRDQSINLFLGQKFYGGLQNTFSYRNVSLDILAQFVKQTGNSHLTGFNLPGLGAFTSAATFNELKVFLDRWQAPGDITTYQQFNSTGNTPYNNARLRGGLTVVDASFIRLKNIALAYNLPDALIKEIKIRSAKVYFQGQNLFTLTPYEGLDPEIQSITNLPPLQVFSLGAQITF